MSSGAPVLLSRFHASCKSLTLEQGSPLTLSKYVERYKSDEQVLALVKHVSPDVISMYHRHLRNDGNCSFTQFLLTRCTGVENALTTAEYLKASDHSKRVAAIIKWIDQLKAHEAKKPVSITAPASAPASAITNARSEQNCDQNCSGATTLDEKVVNFYSQLAKAADQIETKSDQKPVVVHSMTFEAPKTTNVVVQPPTKKAQAGHKDQVDQKESLKNTKKDNKKDVKKDEKPCATDAFGLHIKNIADGNFDRVPRKDLEPLAAHLEAALKSGKAPADYGHVYQRVVDLAHGHFDACKCDDILNALQIVKAGAIENLPRRERRAFVDILSRGSEKTLEQLARQDARGMQILTKNKTALHDLADQDLLRFAPRLAAITAKYSGSNTNQIFVFGHNETPVLRVLLNKNEEEKVAKYMQFRRLSSDEVKTDGPNTFLNNPAAKWNAKLSVGKPFVSRDGKTTIYASAPYSDDVSYFRKWAKQCGCCEQKNSVWLAPTDEAIIARGLHTEIPTWDEVKLKNFVMAHAAKGSSALVSKLKGVAKGEQPWVTDFKMANGKEASAMIKTNIVIDQTSESLFIPVGTVLC